tara:strand:- start:379 stop:711 length:333 start_codon:yes stop_codon:yes gene_type:complete
LLFFFIRFFACAAIFAGTAASLLSNFAELRLNYTHPANQNRLAFFANDFHSYKWRKSIRPDGFVMFVREIAGIRILHRLFLVTGIASLAACFLVWTGLALSWRRLVLPAW